MARIKLTVRRLWKLDGGRMVRTCATAQIYLGDTLIASENIEGMTESPVSKIVHHPGPLEGPLRVEWQSDGVADMVVHDMQGCTCCQDEH
ncbi:hypothetical protein [Pantoea sp. 1.19]|uniref:hypothetical protein n=1 Tax=Pantoea sp. 1.19 TaxID=1925589 RepID=UPI000948EEA3|nr:hypothetical protein [Pantoea sp. 1.19]